MYSFSGSKLQPLGRIVQRCRSPGALALFGFNIPRFGFMYTDSYGSSEIDVMDAFGLDLAATARWALLHCDVR